MKVSSGWKIILGIILCLCIGGIGYMVFKINAPQDKPKTTDNKSAPQAALYLTKETAWPPTSTKSSIRLPLVALNRVTLSSDRQAQKVQILFSHGQQVSAGDIVMRLDGDEEREKLREAEKRFALIQATHDRASALYAVTGSNEQTLKALQDRLIEAEKILTQCRLALSERQIVAPISGIIDYHVSEEGGILPQQPLATIYSTEKLSVEISSEFFSREQLLKQKEKTIPIKILQPVPQIYNAPYTLNTNGNLILHITNHDGTYPIGATVEIAPEALPRTRAIAIPIDAIRSINDKFYVWVKLRSLSPSEALFIRREIKIASTAKGYASLIAGLEPLEEILLNPPDINTEEVFHDTLTRSLAAPSD
jgi:multidrug efflux pump subunit AcrA (membrane-fusion protein)